MKNIIDDKFSGKTYQGYKLVFLVMLICLSGTGCNTQKHQILKTYKKMDTHEKSIADSILAYALDHEALYTLADTLKPMSSVKFYRMPVYSVEKRQQDSARQELATLQKIVNKLSVGDFQFVLNPFERTDSIYRNMEIYVVRRSRLQSLIATHAVYFSKWGLTAAADPATVLAITEYGQKYDRWRSYGYLFGYPDYAVDFFVQAGQSQDSTNEFVKRDFFAIPVYAGERGHFTYAIPKGYQTNETDTLIYNKAIQKLIRYRKARTEIYSKHGRVAIKLWAYLNK